jgi:TonB family protein
MLKKVLISSIFLLTFLPPIATAQDATKPEVAAEPLSRPTCRYCPNPDFPNEAKKAGIFSARGSLEITVSEKGDVDPHDIRVIDDPGRWFREEAVAIVKKWKFNPATDKDGKPAKTRIPVELMWRRREIRH